MITLYDSRITDILPDVFRDDPRVQALGFAVSEEIKRLIGYAVTARVYASIDTASEQIVDLLAIELRTQYYDTSLPLSVKRTLVKNTLVWYQSAGTITALNELIVSVFGSGDIIEWWQDEDEPDPFTFKIRTETPMTGNEVSEFTDMVKKIINVRSHISAVEFLRTVNGTCYVGSAQNGYTISHDIREAGL